MCWLSSTVGSDGWAAGCIVCKLALHFCARAGDAATVNLAKSKTNCAWGKFKLTVPIKLNRLLRHQESAFHRAGELMLCSGKANVQCALLMFAPAADAFESAWLKAESGSRSPDSLAGREKFARLVWCLAEAIRNRHRTFLSEAATIAIHQDKRDSKLLARFTAASPGLERVAGVLGMLTTTGGHLELVDANCQLVAQFCTPGAGMPRRCSQAQPPKPVLDEGLEGKVRSRVEFFNADGDSPPLRLNSSETPASCHHTKHQLDCKHQPL